jgi:hypothetical protein
MVREAQITAYALKRSNAVVPDFASDQVRSRFPSHGHRGPGGMIDGIVEQFGKRVPGDVESLPRSGSGRSLCLETVPNGVLLQAGDGQLQL